MMFFATCATNKFFMFVELNTLNDEFPVGDNIKYNAIKRRQTDLYLQRLYGRNVSNNQDIHTRAAQLKFSRCFAIIFAISSALFA